MTANPESVSATLTAENTFTDPLNILAGDVVTIFVDMTTGSFTGTVTLQRKLPGQSSFFDVTDVDGNVGFTDSINADYFCSERSALRLGVKTGQFAGTNVPVRLGKG